MKVFTTGQAARLLSVAPRTVADFFDSGKLKGYRLPGGSRDRRIPRDALIRFMKEHGFVLPADLRARTAVVLVAFSDADYLAIRGATPEAIALHRAGTLFDAGALVCQKEASVLVVDCGNLDIAGERAGAFAARCLLYRLPLIALILAEGDTFEIQKSEGLAVYQPPFSLAALAERIRDLVREEETT